MIDNILNCTAFMSLAVIGIGIYFCLMMSIHHGSTAELIANDVLNIKVLGTPIGSWPITHFLFYAAAAYNFPNCWPWILVCGTAWEGVEFLINKAYSVKKLDGKNENENVYYNDSWWAANILDLIANNAGVLTGLLLVR